MGRAAHSELQDTSVGQGTMTRNTDLGSGAGPGGPDQELRAILESPGRDLESHNCLVNTEPLGRYL